jgi:hypothetical protein
MRLPPQRCRSLQRVTVMRRSLAPVTLARRSAQRAMGPQESRRAARAPVLAAALVPARCP